MQSVFVWGIRIIWGSSDELTTVCFSSSYPPPFLKNCNEFFFQHLVEVTPKAIWAPPLISQKFLIIYFTSLLVIVYSEFLVFLESGSVLCFFS